MLLGGLRFCLALLCLCSSFSALSLAQGTDDAPPLPAYEGPKLNWLQKLFPSLRPRGGYDAYTTLKAPFADEDSGLEAINIYSDAANEKYGHVGNLQKNLAHAAKAVPLELPHENPPIIRDWLVTVLAQALSFSDQSEAEIQEVLKSFSSSGRAQYVAFLKDNGILDVLKDGGYRVSSILLEPPFLKTDKSVDGRYKWFFEADIMTTYMAMGAKDYRTASARNQQFKLDIQVTRVPVDEDKAKDGLLIEIWRVRK